MRSRAAMSAGLALLLLPAAASGRAVDETRVLKPGVSYTTTAKLDPNEPLAATFSGVFTQKEAVFGATRPCQFDAFYTFGCLAKPTAPGVVFVGYEDERWFPQQLYRVASDSDAGTQEPPPYRADHRYAVKLYCNGRSNSCGRLRVYGGYGSDTAKLTGAITFSIGADTTPAGLRVDFALIVTGKPNLVIRGQKTARLTGSRLVGSGHVTFTKRQRNLLVGTESKGSIVHEDVNGGKRTRLELGIITGVKGEALGSTYSPATGRLSLLLKVKGSNDPACPESGLLTPTLANVTLIPVGGARDEVVLFGYPGTSATEGCKRHAHAWSNGFGGVTVRMKITASK